MNLEMHLIPVEEDQHIAHWDCYCGPTPADIPIFAGPAYRHQPKSAVDVKEGRQCAVFDCPMPGSGFTDEQWWVCERHAKGSPS